MPFGFLPVPSCGGGSALIYSGNLLSLMNYFRRVNIPLYVRVHRF
jgi:hypothetical protein